MAPVKGGRGPLRSQDLCCPFLRPNVLSARAAGCGVNGMGSVRCGKINEVLLKGLFARVLDNCDLFCNLPVTTPLYV